MAEFNGLVDRGLFSLVPVSKDKGCRIYNTHLVDEVKNAGKPKAYEQSRLVVEAYNGSDHGLLTNLPTVQRVSRRLLLAVYTMNEEISSLPRHVSQAYVQSETTTRQPIFVRPPTVLNLSINTLLQVKRPLYGLSEAGLH